MNGKIFMAATLAILSVPGHGQTAAAPPADPLALPSDAPPPPLERMLAPQVMPPAGAAPSAPDATPALPMALAVDLAEAAIAACAAQGLRVGAAVSDAAGNLRVGLTGDGARPGRIFTASRKNVGVIAFGLPTSDVQAKLRADPAMAAQLKPNMAVMPGGLPIMKDGKIIGSLAVSGAASLQDEACAKVALAGMASRLK